MLKPFNEQQKNKIIGNIIKSCADIHALNRVGYNFIYLANGFIAHTSGSGFIGHYLTRSLKDAIIANASRNQWSNFNQGDEHYDYYMSKKDIYNRILAKI